MRVAMLSGRIMGRPRQSIITPTTPPSTWAVSALPGPAPAFIRGAGWIWASFTPGPIGSSLISPKAKIDAFRRR